MLGVASVGTLLATGIVNSWMLVGSVSALIETVYGRWLLAKIALFFVMLVIAAVNRQRLTPQLMDRTNAAVSRTALRRIRYNSLIEATVGAVVIIIVGFLGTIPPASAE